MNAKRYLPAKNPGASMPHPAWLLVLGLAFGLSASNSCEAAEKPSAPSTKGTSAIDKQKGLELIRGFRSDLVLVEGKSGRGSAFIGVIKGRKFLITNAHVMAGVKGAHFKTLDNGPLKLDPAAAVAVGHDIVIWGVAEGGTGMPIMGGAATNAAIGDAVLVPGNVGGEGVVNAVEGEIVGIGPNLIEVSAPIEEGSSGSPVIHVNSGKVLGVATYLTVKSLRSSQDSSGSAKPTVRRFGYRLDSVPQWQPINWSRFYSEAEVIEKADNTTTELIQVLADLQVSARARRANRTFAFDTPEIRTALDSYYADLLSGAGDGSGAGRNLLASLRTASQNGVPTARASLTYDYFKRQFEQEEARRKELMDLFDKALTR
jgi:hypothetical protein